MSKAATMLLLEALEVYRHSSSVSLSYIEKALCEQIEDELTKQLSTFGKVV